jgi:microcystin degradation protein MlrC
MTRKTIAFAEMWTEVNSFSPITTTERDFGVEGIRRGREILDYARKEKKELGGFLKAVDDLGQGEVDLVPIIKARAVPGGPVEAPVYESIRSTVIEGLGELDELHGVYLSLHGSMGVAGIQDPEGDLLESVRRLVGPDIPIGVSFDLHANVTRRDAENATCIIGYKTSPHRDYLKTGYRAGKILLQTVRGEIRPSMAYRKLRLLKGGGMCIDVLPPMRRIFREMKRMEKQPNVLALSNFIVHLFIDEPEVGWSTVAVTDGDPLLADRCAERLADLDWSVRAVEPARPRTPSEAIAIARRARLRRKLGVITFSDTADNVMSGAPGENTWILRALMEEGADLVSYLSLRDEAAAKEAFSGTVGETVRLTVGGRLDTVYNRPLPFTGRLLDKRETSFGKTVVLENRGIHLVVTELSAPVAAPAFFRDLGLGIAKADIVVVKSVFHFRWYFLLQNRKTIYVETPGTTSYDVFRLGHRNVPRPIHPLDDIGSWRDSE